ncbi:MAG: hypothetical protein AABX82_02250 [Nanoarchaeota archaeon]
MEAESLSIEQSPIHNLLEGWEQEMKKAVHVERLLLELDLTHACVPEAEKAKAVNTVRSYRDEKWKKALKLAKNDFQKASEGM